MEVRTMQETTEVRPVDGNGHMPIAAMPHRRTPFDERDPVGTERVLNDPDHERWARYWLEMRQECINHVGDAFDHVMKRFDAGETEGAIALVLFAADESKPNGVYGALADLILKYSLEFQMSDEHKAGVAVEDLVEMARSFR
jgi:hypothetical protein